jgi:hypothetical protein
MNTLQTGFLSEIQAGGELIPAKLGYFRERLRNRIHQFILRQFMAKQKEGLTQADIARILGRRPEQIHRWLGVPGNWTLDTVSDLLLAISKAELEFSADSLEQRTVRNFRGPDWIKAEHFGRVPKRALADTSASRMIQPTTSFDPTAARQTSTPSPATDNAAAFAA